MHVQHTLNGVNTAKNEPIVSLSDSHDESVTKDQSQSDMILCAKHGLESMQFVGRCVEEEKDEENCSLTNFRVQYICIL